MPDSHIDLKGNTNYVLLKDVSDTVVVSAGAASDQVTIGGSAVTVSSITLGQVIGGYTVTNIDTTSGYKIRAEQIFYMVPRTSLAALDLIVGPGIDVQGNTVSVSDTGVLFVPLVDGAL